LKLITDYIDSYINTQLADPNIHYYGLAELVTKNTERFPTTVNGRVKVSFDNSYSAFCYHRIISNSPTINEDVSFGLERVVQENIIIRTVLAYKIDEYDEMFRYEFENSMPRTIRVSGYDPIFIEPSNANEDHEAIVNEEFLQLPYEKHRLPWNVYSFDNSTELILCDE
jgi:hypothetical protein